MGLARKAVRMARYKERDDRLQAEEEEARRQEEEDAKEKKNKETASDMTAWRLTPCNCTPRCEPVWSDTPHGSHGCNCKLIYAQICKAIEKKKEKGEKREAEKQSKEAELKAQKEEYTQWHDGMMKQW